ncbi:MAG: rhamnan synthesis F family protein [Tabrizicola sp.]|nr:rhamnan synthesis F family protein [Tabrizicola sp.]
MIPRWKIAREVDRAGQQVRALFGHMWEPVVQRAHDRRRADILDVETGAVPLTAKVAIYLLYQPNGLLPSTLVTCNHLRDKGYAPLVVSNTPLSREDRDRLNALAWKTVIRPNYGYDFGGYRDGVLSLADWQVAPDRLIILNDSVWFPIAPDETLIDRMEALEADMCGGVIHLATHRRKTSTKRRPFIESYFYLLNRSALAHPAHDRFWKTFRVSSNKYNAVYRGERGFSHAMQAAGLRVAGVLDSTRLVAALEAEDDQVLRKTLDYAAYTDPDFMGENDTLRASFGTEGWRHRALDHVRRVVTRRSFHASFPYASIRLLGTPYIKKGTGTFLKRTYGTLHSVMRRKYLEAVRAGDLPAPYPEVLTEIEARAAQDQAQ